jgi:hypothetical protein
MRRDVLYNTLIKLVRLIKMCLSEIYSKVHIGKHLSDSFPMQNGLKPHVIELKVNQIPVIIRYLFYLFFMLKSA